MLGGKIEIVEKGYRLLQLRSEELPFDHMFALISITIGVQFQLYIIELMASRNQHKPPTRKLVSLCLLFFLFVKLNRVFLVTL